MFLTKPKYQIVSAYPIELGYICVEVLYSHGDGKTRSIYCRDAKAIVRIFGRSGLATINKIIYSQE